MKQPLLLLITLLMAVTGSATGREKYIDPGDRRFHWKDVSYQELRVQGTVSGTTGPESEFQLTLRLGKETAKEYLTRNHLSQRNVLGWYPGEVATIEAVSLRIGRSVVSLGAKAMKDVVNPKMDSVRVNAFDNQFLITFEGPDAAESYRCQLRVDKKGFRYKTTERWVGGRGFSAAKVTYF